MMDIDMQPAETDPQASCIRITDRSNGTPYFVSATFREDGDGEQCFDLKVTDLKHAWTATGHRRPKTSRYLDRWLAVAREALTGVRDDALDTRKPVALDESPYKWEVEPEYGKVKLAWEFGLMDATTGKYTTWKGKAEAEEAADAGAIIEALVSQLVANANSYKASCLSLQKTVTGFQKETEFAQAALDKELTEREQREQDLYIKFAAVLNESKKKCREWQQRAESAQQRLDAEEATPTEHSASEAESTDMDDGGDVGNMDNVSSTPVAAHDFMDADTQPISAPAAEPEPAQQAPESESEPEPETVPRRRVAAKKRRVAVPNKESPTADLSTQ